MPENTRPIIHLFIPQLLQPLIVWKKDFGFEAECPYLSLLLRQFLCEKTSSSQGLSESLFSSIGLPESIELPTAYYRFQVHKNRSIEKSIVCADPVHLEVGLTDVTLTESIVDLTDDESHELIALLNGHFKQDNIEFIFGSSSQWYISFPDELIFDDEEKLDNEFVKTQPLEQVIRENIVNYLPKSSRSSQSSKGSHQNWQVIQNEMQMLLHGSEVNQQREMAGLPTLNSLWFWGAGEPIAKTELIREMQLVMGGSLDEGIIQGKTIAKALEVDWQAPDANAMEHRSFSINTMIILDQLIPAVSNQQPEQFQDALTQIDNDYIKPLMVLWKERKIELIINPCDGSLIKPH